MVMDAPVLVSGFVSLSRLLPGGICDLAVWLFAPIFQLRHRYLSCVSAYALHP
jgi:hypothetical protein